MLSWRHLHVATATELSRTGVWGETISALQSDARIAYLNAMHDAWRKDEQLPYPMPPDEEFSDGEQEESESESDSDSASDWERDGE